MKKIFALLAGISLGVMVHSVANATSYTYTPQVGSSVLALDHDYLYMWGINASIDSNEVVTGASISIKNIDNWDNNANVLKFYLLDNLAITSTNSTMDVIRVQDNGTSTMPWRDEIPEFQGDKFTANTFLTVWSDTNGTGNVSQFDYLFSSSQVAALNTYLATSTNGFNNNFGLGFDPDCRFYNDGITFTIETAPVPEPGTILLLGVGLIGLGFYGRRRIQK